MENPAEIKVGLPSKRKALEELYEAMDGLYDATKALDDYKKKIREAGKIVADGVYPSPFQIVLWFMEAGLSSLRELSEASMLQPKAVQQFLKALTGGVVVRVVEEGKIRNGRYFLKGTRPYLEFMAKRKPPGAEPTAPLKEAFHQAEGKICRTTRKPAGNIPQEGFTKLTPIPESVKDQHSNRKRQAVEGKVDAKK